MSGPPEVIIIKQFFFVSGAPASTRVSQIFDLKLYWSYAQIIFQASFDNQGGSIRMSKWPDGAR
jgi:hypothetical protein